MRSVPVLMYHHILPKEDFIASSIETFEAQMRFLAYNDYHTLTSEEFAAFKRGEWEAPPKSVFITFDDGWRDNYIYAYPILKKYALKATLFLVTEWVEEASKKYMPFSPLSHKEAKRHVAQTPSVVILNWDEIETMSDLFDFHAHTHSHRDFYFGKHYSWEEDLFLCQERLKKRVGIQSRHLCWPRGEYDAKTLQLAKKMYDFFYTTKRGINMPDGKMDLIKRIAAKKGEKWLKKQLFFFRSPLIGALYSKVKP